MENEKLEETQEATLDRKAMTSKYAYEHRVAQ